MKKSLYSFVVIFMITSLSFANLYQKRNCRNYAMVAVIQEQVAYGFMSNEEIADAQTWYYDACVGAGGNIDDPVFL